MLNGSSLKLKYSLYIGANLCLDFRFPHVDRRQHYAAIVQVGQSARSSSAQNYLQTDLPGISSKTVRLAALEYRSVFGLRGVGTAKGHGKKSCEPCGPDLGIVAVGRAFITKVAPQYGWVMTRPQDDLLRRFGLRLRALRKRRGLSQEAFAAECGLDRTYIGGVERGERNLALRNIEAIAKTLGAAPLPATPFGVRGTGRIWVMSPLFPRRSMLVI